MTSCVACEESDKPDGQPAPFYTDAKKYWSTVAPTVDGMLGGFSHISSTDIGGSVAFLHHFTRGPAASVGSERALDCGAGIGRITKRLLLSLFKRVDMVEQNQAFVDQAPSYLGSELASRVDRYICQGLQDFTPEAGRYDVIWCQWVLGHLKDQDLINFLHRCVKGLNTNGIIVLKENISTSDIEFDEKDSSFTRPREKFLSLFKTAGLTVLKEEKQKHFPKNIYDVLMFALH